MNVPEKYREYDMLLRSKLDDYRYIHSLGVAKSAKELAALYGADEEKAYTAGLLHDVMKNASPDEQLQIMEKADIILSPCEKLNQKLWHAIAGAAFLKTELNITDEEIISAVRWHTTGKAGMTTLEKTVYLADFISEDRTYPDVDEVRRLAHISLERAIVYTQKYCIQKLLSQNMIIDPSSVECYNDLVRFR
ncbi:MAG: bis(5'-nucleosyl)-tetraphosphatase (symmetrical) YqeK [Acutalibacteraceae bacterium]